VRKQFFTAIALSALSSLSHAYIVSYKFEGTVTHFPDPIFPINHSNDLMSGFLSFDTEDFLRPNVDENGNTNTDYNRKAAFSYSITAGGLSWNSRHALDNTNPLGALTSNGNLLGMQDDAPAPTLVNPDLIYLNLLFSDTLLSGSPPTAEEFVSGTWNLTHFLEDTIPFHDAVMFGTIDKVTMRASVPEPSSLALASLGFAGLLLRRRFSK